MYTFFSYWKLLKGS